MCVCVCALIMYHYICSPLFCYTLFALAMDNTTTMCHHQLSIVNAFDFFDVMNVENIGNDERTFVFGALAPRVNYTLYVRLPNDLYDKRMIIFEGMRAAHTHRVCSHALTQTIPLASVGIIYLLTSCIIVMVVVWSINRCLKRTSTTPTPTQRPWERFLSTLRRFNMVPQSDSS